jgi:flagellar motility protein MotE (MotC chaperone)
VRFKFRLIPLVLAAAVLLLGVKLGDLWSVLGARAEAQQAQPQAAPAAPAPTASAPAAPAPADAKETSAESGAGAATPPADPNAKPGAAAAADPLLMSPSEMSVLQKLSERRAELDRRAQEMAQEEVVLKAAEQRLDEKLGKLKTIQQGIGGLVDQQDQQGEQRAKSLVKIYETMKPREAARIFEELDMPVVLDVLEHMKEAKAAPILASMDPVKAKGVTAALAERKLKGGTESAKAATP